MIISVWIAISACQPDAVAVSDVEIEQPDPTSTITAAPPPVMVTIAGSQNQSSFSPLTSAELAATATSQAESMASNPADETADNPEIIETNESPASTPLPTFTPPALPRTSPWEHYWFRRPVPEGGTVWTDKAYPYGSSRSGTLRTHHGVEFNVPRGTEVMAAASGTVVFAGPDRLEDLGATPDFYGNVIVLEHDSELDGQPVFSVYGHLSQILVNVGDHVQALDVIALSGASGVADGPHLHFEVRVGENSYDATRNPLLWLYPFPDRGVVAGRITHDNGLLAREAPVSLRRVDAPSAYAGTTTYADDSVNPDEMWQENFALDDVEAGYYELTVGSGKDKQKAEFWVHPYQTTFVEVILEK